MDIKYCPNTLRIFSECSMSEKKGLTPSYIGVRALPLLYLVIYIIHNAHLALLAY